MIESFQEQIEKKSDSELADIIININRYQKEFVDLTEIELCNRNIPIDSIIELRIKNLKIQDEILEIGDKGSPFWIAIGFLGSLFGGLFSIFLGYSYAFSKRKNSIGKEFYVYDESTRKYGRKMFYFGLLIFLVFFYFRFLGDI
jgi:hypothetical protein